MCVAILNKESITLSDETLKICWENNSDGAGMAWVEDGEVKIFKEVTSVDTFLTKYKSIRENYKGNMLLHFRIATHGAVCEDNCHPFSVSSRLAFIHNGVIRNTATDKNKSDTGEFNDKILKDLPNGFYKNASILKLIEDYVGTSKLVFLDSDGETTIVNEKLGEWESGCWFSNKSYQKKKETVPVYHHKKKEMPRVSYSWSGGKLRAIFKKDAWVFNGSEWENRSADLDEAYKELGFPAFLPTLSETKKTLDFLQGKKIESLYITVDQAAFNAIPLTEQALIQKEQVEKLKDKIPGMTFATFQGLATCCDIRLGQDSSPYYTTRYLLDYHTDEAVFYKLNSEERRLFADYVKDKSTKEISTMYVAYSSGVYLCKSANRRVELADYFETVHEQSEREKEKSKKKEPIIPFPGEDGSIYI